ncbi:MAG TPA: hypothetical protein VGN17_05365 [Bryobacteraceae bacterium]
MVRTLAAIGVFTLLLPAQGLFGQTQGVINLQRVPSAMMYHRVWAVTPLVGAGTQNDPVRPLFVPAPPQVAQKGATALAVSAATSGSPAPTSDRPGVIGYQMQLSDDGKSALVEYVFASPVTFQAQLQQEAMARGIAIATTGNRAAPAPLHPGLAAPSAAQAALEAAVPALKLFERGKATDDDILTEFRKYKANYVFTSATVRPR